MENCIFCKIINKEIPANIVYEDKHSFAFLDISPINHGHTLVIPKKHYETIQELPENILTNLIKTVQKIAKAIEADGINIMQNNKPAAGQAVPHLHFHIIPRFKDDGFQFNWRNKEYKDNETETILKKLKENL